MRRSHSTGEIIFTATDLTRFAACRRCAWNDRINLDTPLPQATADPTSELFAAKGAEHEQSVFENYGADAVSIPLDLPDTDRYTATVEAMRGGTACVYQGYLRDGQFAGFPDFLVRRETPSSLGEFGFEVLDAKLSRTTKTGHIVQLCLYSDMLVPIQGTVPQHIAVALATGSTETYRFLDFAHYCRSIRAQFLKFVDSGSEPEALPCAHCGLCRWRDLCKQGWESSRHLCITANITRGQIERLREGGVRTIHDLAAAERPTGIVPEVFDRLQRQAELQVTALESGERRYELRPEPYLVKGLPQMSEPSKRDLFYDIEGDPLFGDRGLEYLHGVYYFDNRKPVFDAYWAHSEDEEREEFRKLIRFFIDQFEQFPKMHIYHYNHYETTALKRLMTVHGTMEDEVDHLLRNNVFVDLYPIVRNSLIISESSYSLKYVEHFYLKKREGEVTNAGDSIVEYERYRDTGDQGILDNIEAYNRIDCESTMGLRDWLLEIKRNNPMPEVEIEESLSALNHEPNPHEEIVEQYLGNRPEVGKEDADIIRLLVQLYFYHKREKKPSYWSMFSRQEMSDEELLDDCECLALCRVQKMDVFGNSRFYDCVFPPQEVRIKDGQEMSWADDVGNGATVVGFDQDACTIQLKQSTRRAEFSGLFSLIPGWPINTNVLEAALRSFIAGAVGYLIKGVDLLNRAGLDLLQRRAPRIRDLGTGSPLLSAGHPEIAEVCDIVERMDETCLYIQGPPGSGKTYTGSHVIHHLLRHGQRVAVTSNSHKAINNLLNAVEERCLEAGFTDFAGWKKSSKEGQFLVGEIIEDTTSNYAVPEDVQLLAGTAWLLCREDWTGVFDYLFIDEAGQVPLANCLAMSTCARNIVLLGDQMQLGSPIQAAHPGRSGYTALDYLLEGTPVIPPTRGIFLDRTWRMHPDVCRFISNAVYDSQLESVERTAVQNLRLPPELMDQFPATGISFVPLEHRGNSQESAEEAEFINKMINSLLGCKYVNQDGATRKIGLDNILVVAPYNMQVNRLKQTLPEGARVGTVDKFQGQEAEVVFVSMATSSQDTMPRHFEFLFSLNRLNVALSRARIKAFLVCSPELLRVSCSTVEQMKLVNTLCWAAEEKDC